MGIFLVYILKSAACLAVFYLFYKLLMSRDTFHRFNRFALLGLLVLSSLLPLVKVSVEEPAPVHETMLTLEQLLMLAGEADSAEVATVPVQPATVGWIQVMMLVYLAGIVFFALRNGWSLCRLGVLLRRGRLERVSDYLPGRGEKVRLVVHDQAIAPFSWMRNIVISRKDLDESGREILIHELAHIRNHHSWDLLLVDLCIFVQWFNPAAWLLKQDLQNIHEYEADETVLREGVNAKDYQMLLIKKAVGTRLYSMANSFNHSSLKKRITMMLKEKSSPWARMKYLYVLPLVALALTAFARPEVSAVADEISSAKVNDLVASVKTNLAETASVAVKDTLTPGAVNVPQEVKDELKGTPVFEVVEQMPEFPDGGMAGLMDYFQKNMRYPAEAKEAGKQGRVTVQFVVNKDGSISGARVLRGVDPLLDAEAIRLVNAMPKWKPGMQQGKPVAVKYTVPVRFGDAKSADGASANPVKQSVIRLSNNTPSDLLNTLILIDGKEIDPELVNIIDMNKIESVSILKDKASVEKYTSDKSKTAVMLITMKKEDKAGDRAHLSRAIMADGTERIIVSNEKDLDAKDVVYYIDGKRVDLPQGEDGFKELGISAEDIDHVEVKKNDDGTGSLYITTKKAVKQSGEVKVQGQVVDKQGEAVIGAYVKQEGTNNGTVTDVDGKFSLPVPKDAVLVVGYVGMKEARAKAQPVIRITLEED